MTLGASLSLLIGSTSDDGIDVIVVDNGIDVIVVDDVAVDDEGGIDLLTIVFLNDIHIAMVPKYNNNNTLNAIIFCTDTNS